LKGDIFIMKRRKLIGSFLAMALVLGMSFVPIKAATNYTPVAGTSTTFNKNLIMDAGDTVPNATFSFTVAPGSAISADTSDNTVMQVLPGVGTPTIANVTFAPTDTTTTTTNGNIDVQRDEEDRTGTAGTDTVQLDSDEKFATKTATVDFSGVTFDEPGIYRYIITETTNAAHVAAGIIHDTDTDRVLDVYVTDDGNGGLVVSSYVLHTTASNPAINATMGSADVATAGAALDDKTDGFTNEFISKDLKVEKAVTGNQASRDKYFEFTVTCTDVADADSYVVSIADDNDANTNDGSANATSGSTAATIAANAGKTNPTIVTGAQLKAGQKFYLNHGQSIVIRGLAPNAEYTVTENAEDYASAVTSGHTNSGVIGTVAGANKMVTAGFTNTRNGVIPTGVVTALAGGLAVLGLGAGGLLVCRKKKEDEEE
jgi:hypothetical protein